MAHLEITEVALVLAILLTTVMKRIQESFIHLFLINHLVNYQVFHTKDFIILKNFNSEFAYIEVWFTYQNSRPLKMEDKINIILVIN